MLILPCVDSKVKQFASLILSNQSAVQLPCYLVTLSGPLSAALLMERPQSHV